MFDNIIKYNCHAGIVSISLSRSWTLDVIRTRYKRSLHGVMQWYIYLVSFALSSALHELMSSLFSLPLLEVDAGGAVVYSEVRAFMKRQPDDVGDYTIITTETGHVMSLSPSHVIFASKSNMTSYDSRFVYPPV